MAYGGLSSVLYTVLWTLYLQAAWLVTRLPRLGTEMGVA